MVRRKDFFVGDGIDPTLALIAGGATGVTTNMLLGGGLAFPAAPGSIIAVGAAASAEASVRLATAYAKDREAFGDNLMSFQNTRFVLAECVGDALAADFYLEIADAMPGAVADVVRSVLSETGHSQFVVAEVRSAVTASDRQRHRLALWSRRLLGEAITQAQYVMADHDELVDLVMSAGGLSQITEFFDRLQQTHSTRMQELGLA